MNTDELQLIYDNLTYFDKDLLPVEEEWLKARDNEELKHQLVLEGIFVNRLNTIASNNEWVLAHEYSPFKQKLFKKIITDPTTETDEFQSVKGFGTKMSKEEWEVYEEFHNKLFIVETV